MTHSKLFITKQLIISLLLIFSVKAWGQPGAVISIQKPAKYERRTLPSEKPSDKPINPIRRATQNLGSHYNYHFNGTQKLNEILMNARTAQKDDFTQLLSFYPISLDAAAGQSGELDSVIGKCNDAILLHDLRSDWVDDFYLLMGKAYFYRKEFDSALITLQYLNYAFQPRSKDEIGFPKSIGSNVNQDGNSFTISTNEKSNLLRKIASNPPARNEALLWIIRCFTEKNEKEDAWSLVETLKRDKQFPKRLEGSLHELQAYLFYNQEQYDSAAFYLETSLDEFASVDKPRQEFLLAQLYERSRNYKKADYWYEKSIGHTTNLIMEAFARINRIKLIQNQSSNEKINEQIVELMKMVKKEKYADYTHFIYYAVAQMEKARDSISPALYFLQKSATNSFNDPAFRNKAFLELGELAWNSRNYRLSALGYDSVIVNDSSKGINAIELNQRKSLLSKIINYMDIIQVEDSLIQIAEMPEAERLQYLKNLLRQLRKEKGLKDETPPASNVREGVRSVIDLARDEKPADLFAQNKTKGEWYFYNISIKSRGIREFEATWGNRPNTDNWRRAKAITNTTPGIATLNESSDIDPVSTSGIRSKAKPTILTLEALEANLPLTQEKRQISLDTIEVSMYQLGKILRESINDCPSTIQMNEELINRFPKSPHIEEILFSLFYCYNQLGNTEKANKYKNYLSVNHAQSRYLKLINDPKAIEKENKQLTEMATAAYEKIYQSFLEGDFDVALKDKRMADSSFGDNYWTPQLLYIESIYHIRQRNDSLATKILDKLQMLFPTSPMAPKAKILADVLSKRAELEKYLTDLTIERVHEDSIFINSERATVIAPKRNETNIPNKIDPSTPGLSAPEIPRSKETVKNIPAKSSMDTLVFSKKLSGKTDTSAFIKKSLPKDQIDGYTFNPLDEHLVLLVLQKIDVVYLNEAKIALNRYNKVNLADKNLDIQSLAYNNEIRFLTIQKFSNLTDAETYFKMVRIDASRIIFPWLPATKYYFLIVNSANLEIMRNKQDLDRYKQLYSEKFPIK